MAWIEVVQNPNNSQEEEHRQYQEPLNNWRIAINIGQIPSDFFDSSTYEEIRTRQIYMDPETKEYFEDNLEGRIRGTLIEYSRPIHGCHTSLSVIQTLNNRSYVNYDYHEPERDSLAKRVYIELDGNQIKYLNFKDVEVAEYDENGNRIERYFEYKFRPGSDNQENIYIREHATLQSLFPSILDVPITETTDYQSLLPQECNTFRAFFTGDISRMASIFTT